MCEKIVSFDVGARSSKLIEYNGTKVHPFQKEALEAINSLINNGNSKFTIIKITAPVGAGKSFIMRHLITAVRGFPLIFTYPTKILLDTQINSMVSEIRQNGLEAFANWKEFKKNDKTINIFKYTTDEIVRIGLQDNQVLKKRRGEIIATYLMNAITNYRFPVMATTPDVLHILYNLKHYGGRYTKRIIDFLTKSIVIFDEFHAYHNLENFYLLLQSLSEFSKFVILLSATPYINKRRWRKIEASYDILTIDFNEAENRYTSNNVRTFNNKLNVNIIQVDNFSENRTHIEPILNKIHKVSGLHVVIYNSIFRLRHHRDLINRFHGIEWSGMKKEELSKDKHIIFGTSSIEVGVHLPFRTLITEVDNWVSAIQRIGRVGRETDGSVYLLTRSRDLLLSFDNGEKYDRSTFEDKIRKNLPDPHNDLVAGELFRGNSYNFLIYDRTINETYAYSESIFSMYKIDDPRSVEDREEFKEELRELATLVKFNEEKIRELEVRDIVSPFYGILYGRLRKYYVKLEYERIGRSQIKITKPELLMFRRSDV